jgi:hypothetical protein
MDLSAGPAFVAIRLHRRSGFGWAVIRRETGAIVADLQNRLLIRLSEQAAREAAADLTRRHRSAAAE